MVLKYRFAGFDARPLSRFGGLRHRVQIKIQPAAVRDKAVLLKYRNLTDQNAGRDQIVLDSIRFARAFADEFTGGRRERAGQEQHQRARRRDPARAGNHAPARAAITNKVTAKLSAVMISSSGARIRLS